MNTDHPRLLSQDYLMPAADAMLAATLALMTGHAQSQDPRQRACLAEKIAAQLQELGQRADLSPALRPALHELRHHWLRLCQGSAVLWGEPCQWHASAALLQ